MNTTYTNPPPPPEHYQAVPAHHTGVSGWAGVALLILGLVIGFFCSKPYWQRGWGGTGTWAGHSASNMDYQRQQANPTVANDSTASGPNVNANAIPLNQTWDPVRQMREMQAQVDQVFQRSFADFGTNSGLGTLAAKPGYSLTMDVRDLKDKYQIRAFLPDIASADAKVNLKGDELKVDVSNKITEKPTKKNGEIAEKEWGNYEEVVQLAGPLKDSQMTVKHLPHELLISVPKA